MDATSTASFRWLKHAKTFPRHQDRLSAPQQTADLFATEQEHRDRQIAIERIESLAQSDRIKNEFLATVCHELRSPIGAIQNAVKVLRSPNNAAIPLQHQMCALIERQSQQMAFLVAGLLDITSIGRGQLCLHRQLVDLSAILRNAIETLEWDLKGRCHRLEISGLESPVWLMADAARLEQVFANLLGNASKYTAAGGDIALSLHVSDGSAIVRIRDSGIGLAPDALPHIFNLFMQVRPAAQRSASGLGIGLALVRAFVEAHRGNVAAVSAGLGHGSEFTVRLPLEQ
jgi:two-component system CheB/CheR fusion protein